MDIVDYFDSKGLEPKVQGKWVYIICPVCTKHKLSISLETETGCCHVCKAESPNEWTTKLHVSQIIKYFNDSVDIAPLNKKEEKKEGKKEINLNSLSDRYHNNLMENKKGIKYLLKRNISEESIVRFKLGYADFKNQKWISIPSYEKGICKLIKYRKLPEDTNPKVAKCIREYGSDSILFNCDALDKYDDIIIAEGEFDAISLLQAGYDNVIGLTVGAGTLKPEWYDDLLLKDKIYLCLDSDKAGQKAAKDVFATRLGFSRCWNIVLPENTDVNDYFMDHTKDDFDILIKKAYTFRIDNIVSLEAAFDEMYIKSLDGGDSMFELPWGNVNEVIGGGLAKSQLMVIGASAGIGKTTMSLQIAYHFAKVHKIPSLIFCLEMPVDQLLAKIILNELDMEYDELRYDEAYTYRLMMEDLPIYFGYSPNITPEIYYNTVKEARNKYGCELFIFDNLQLMVISDTPTEYDRAVAMFKNMTMELNVINILISQPRKINDEGRNINYQDLKGSSSLSQAPDKILLLDRKRNKDEGKGAFEKGCKVINEKARFSKGGTVWLKYVGEKARFEEYAEGEERE